MHCGAGSSNSSFGPWPQNQLQNNWNHNSSNSDTSAPTAEKLSLLHPICIADILGPDFDNLVADGFINIALQYILIAV